MLRYVIVSIGSGLLFGILDGILNANPLARRLFAVYEPIARTSVNAPAGLLIDLGYGFALAGMFVLLRHCLPGPSGLVKGLSFAAGLWFLRVVMGAASTWMMFRVPAATIAYGVGAGLVEMLALGLLYGLTLAPPTD
jgi:hypothetical protein